MSEELTIEQKINKNTLTVNRNDLNVKENNEKPSIGLILTNEDSCTNLPADRFNFEQCLSSPCVYLPAGKHILPIITISCPLAIRGSPGSVLEIQNSLEITSSLELSELSIIFTGDQYLFELLEGSLKLQDCDIRSETGVCIHSKLSQIEILSCNVTGFSTVCMANNSILFIEKSQFFECENSCLIIENPYSLRLKNAKIEGCSGSAIDISLSLGLCINVTSQVIEERKISIEESSIHKVDGNGINIRTDKQGCAPYSIYIRRNQISNTTKHGLTVSHSILRLEITSNIVYANKENGISLYKVHTKFSMKLACNRVSHCKNGVCVHQSECIMYHNDICENAMDGILLIGHGGNRGILSSQSLQIFRGTISKNGKNGVSLLNCFSGYVNISKVSILQNTEHGVSVCFSGKEPFVNIKKSRICNNGRLGLHGEHFVVSDTEIQDNDKHKEIKVASSTNVSCHCTKAKCLIF